MGKVEWTLLPRLVSEITFKSAQTSQKKYPYPLFLPNKTHPRSAIMPTWVYIRKMPNLLAVKLVRHLMYIYREPLVILRFHGLHFFRQLFQIGLMAYWDYLMSMLRCILSICSLVIFGNFTESMPLLTEADISSFTTSSGRIYACWKLE